MFVRVQTADCSDKRGLVTMIRAGATGQVGQVLT